MNNIRRDAYGDDKHKAIEDKYGSKDEASNLLKFNHVYADKKGKQRLMGFSRSKVLGLLKNNGLNMHVDCTFDVTPPGFAQTLILSIRDAQSELHCPVFIVLMTTKTYQAYSITFFLINISIGT